MDRGALEVATDLAVTHMHGARHVGVRLHRPASDEAGLDLLWAIVTHFGGKVKG